MPLSITERWLDPDDPNDPFRRLARATSTDSEHTPWVAPDYQSITPDAELHGPGPHLAWPGPPLVMPAGLLPDGQPPSRNEMTNAERINSVRPANSAEADSVVIAYQRQQRALRDRAGLPRPTRAPPTYQVTDTPATLSAIAQLHEAERRRRASGRR